MIDDMYNVMTRINELRGRFGLNKTVREPDRNLQLNSTFDAMTGDAMRILPDEEERLITGRDVTRGDIDRLIDHYSGKRNIPASLVKSVISVESGFDPDAVSPKGAMGLMQLMPSTVMDMGVENPFDPEDNIKGGTQLLRNLLDNYKGDYRQALAAYNAGKSAVDRAGGAPPYKETEDYVKRVIDIYAGGGDK